MKCKLQHFNVLIIDEISMVENCEDTLLSGVSLLAVGASSVFASWAAMIHKVLNFSYYMSRGDAPLRDALFHFQFQNFLL